MEIAEKSISRVDSAVDVLSGKLKDILAQKEKGVIQVDSDCIVVEAARKMRDNKVGALMVLENGELVGIFTERDLMSRVVAERLDPETVKVSAAMTSSIATVPLETPIREAANLMSQNRIRHLPVLQDGKLCGVISAGDIFAWKLREQEFTLHYFKMGSCAALFLLEIFLRGNFANRNSLSTSWRIIFLKPDNQYFITDIFPSRPVCS